MRPRFRYALLCFAIFPGSTLNMATPFIFIVLTLDQADAEAWKMIGDVSVIEYSQLLTRQAAGRANLVYDGELPPRANPHKADDDAGPSRKRTRGQVKLAPRKRWVPACSDSDADDEDDVEERDDEEEGEEEEGAEAAAGKAANEAVENRAETPGYTPTPSPGHNETGVESNSSHLDRKDLEGAKVLVAFSAGKVAKGVVRLRRPPRRKDSSMLLVFLATTSLLTKPRLRPPVAA